MHFALIVDGGESSSVQRPPSQTLPPHNTPTRDSPEIGTRRRKLGLCSPNPIAVFGSKPQSPSFSRQAYSAKSQDGSQSGSLMHTETVGIQTSGSAMESEPGSNFEIISMEEGSVHFSEELGEDLIKPMDGIEENEQDFISLEAQKLAGDILHESQLEDLPPQEGDDEEEEQNLDTEPATSLSPQQHDEKERSDGIEQGSVPELQGVSLASVRSGASITLVDAVGVDASEDHMTSRSSTIFVDMTGLNIESHETQETQA